jgi:hypothetical protein
MQPNTPIRVFYHFAPTPDVTGHLVTPAPVTLTTEARNLPYAWRWIRRRLGLHAHGSLTQSCIFTDEVLPLPDPEAPRAMTPHRAGPALLRRKVAVGAVRPEPEQPDLEDSIAARAAAAKAAAQAAAASGPDPEVLADLAIPAVSTKPQDEAPTLPETPKPDQTQGS